MIDEESRPLVVPSDWTIQALLSDRVGLVRPVESKLVASKSRWYVTNPCARDVRGPTEELEWLIQRYY